MQRILLTGSNGFVGQWVDSSSPPNVALSRLDASSVDESVERFIRADLSCKGSLRDLDRNFDGIIHLAGVSRVVDGEADPIRCFEVNLIGSLQVLQFAREHDVKPWIILGGTIEPPVNMYGLSKRQMEHCAEIFSKRYGLSILSLRFSNIFGAPNDNQHKLLPILIQSALQNEKISIIGAEQQVNLISVTDVARAIWCGADYLSQKEPSFKAIDICGREALGRGELARRVVKLAKSASIIEFANREETGKPGNIEKDVEPLPDPATAFDLLGFQCNPRINDQLLSAIDSYRRFIE